MNNLDIRCCPVEPLASTCEPKERWQFISECNNLHGFENLTCEVNLSKNLKKTFWVNETHSVAEVFNNLDIQHEDQYASLIRNFQLNIGHSKRTDFNWRSFGGALMTEHIEIPKLVAKPGETVHLYRVLGKCGIYFLSSEHYKQFSHELPDNLIEFN